MTLAICRSSLRECGEDSGSNPGREGGVTSADVRPANRVVLLVEYDGTNYSGFQLQVARPTIQGELEEAIRRLTGERGRVVGASRTDAGVHAMNQVVSFRTGSLLPLNRFVGGLNYYLPRDIVVKQAYRPAEGFHVQRSVVHRRYDYFILNRPVRSPLRERYSYLVREQIDVKAMGEAARVLAGEHDFASFTSGDLRLLKSTVRKVWRADVRRDGETVVFTIVANSFMPHQVRNTVGSLLSVGMGRMGIDEFRSIMERKKPGLAGPKVPASGLHLMQIDYPDVVEEESNENV